MTGMRERLENLSISEISCRRKGFLHAMDSALASILLTFFLLSVVQSPPRVSWQSTQLQKKGEGLLCSMDHSGVLDNSIMRADGKSFRAVVSAFESDMSTSLRYRGLPPFDISFAVIDQNLKNHTVNVSWEGNDSSALSLDLSSTQFNKSRYAYLSGNFSGIQFLIIGEQTPTAIDEYEFVGTVWDLDQDNVIDKIGGCQNGKEGLCDSGTMFQCKASGGLTPALQNNCSGNQYELGSYNSTFDKNKHSKKFVLYSSPFRAEADLKLSSVKFNERDINFDPEIYEWLDLTSDETTDVVFVNKLNLSDSYKKEYIKEYLRDDNLIIAFQNLTEDYINSSSQFFHDLGYKWLTHDYSSSDEYTFYERGDSNYPSFRTGTFFHKTPIIRQNHEDSINNTPLPSQLNATGWTINESVWTLPNSYGGYKVNNITLKGNTYNFVLTNTSVGNPGFERIYLSNNSNFSEGYQMAEQGKHLEDIGGNDYKVEELVPLKLEPNRSYEFKDLSNGNISSKDPIIKLNSTSYNYGTSDLDVDKSTSPISGLGGVPASNCSSDPYRETNFDLKGKTYRVVLTCRGGEYEYVNFDLNTNNNYGNTVNGVEEGPYLPGEKVVLKDRQFNISINGDRIVLQQIPPDNVGVLPNSRKAADNLKGQIVFFPETDLGEDDWSLIRSIILEHESRKIQTLGSPSSVASPAVGVSYIGELEKGDYIPYEIKSKWYYG